MTHESTQVLLVAAVAAVEAHHALCRRDERVADLCAAVLGELERHLRQINEQDDGKHSTGDKRHIRSKQHYLSLIRNSP